MSFIKKILGREDDDLSKDNEMSNDPFSQESGLGLPDLDQNTTNNNQEAGTGTNNQGMNNMMNDPMGMNNPIQNNLDYNNPDINQQTNTPKPDPYNERNQNQTINTTGIINQGMNNQNTPDYKDIQIIIAKLDAIKAELDSLQQRVQKIERIAEADQAAAQLKEKTNYGRW